MVRVFGPKTVQHSFLDVRFSVAIGVFQEQQICTLRDIATTVTGFDAGGNQQSFGEHGRLIGFSVSVGVFQDQNFVWCTLADFDHRIRFAAGHPQTTLRVKVNLDRLVELWIFCPQRDFQIFAGRKLRSRLLGELGVLRFDLRRLGWQKTGREFSCDFD